MGKGEEEKRTIKTHEDLIIYQKTFNVAMRIFELSRAISHRRKIFSLISNPVEYLSYIWGWSVWSVWSVWEGWGEGEVERLKARKCG
ncbi:MAG: hypothetical protein F6K17_20010 [Okeania sp. SIO3C4]|nr:hypothetical protein [Okeania sp. SIO3C4]